MKVMSIFKNFKNGTGSVFFRVSAIVAICTAGVAGTMDYLSLRAQVEVAEGNTKELALNLTTFASVQSASAIRFANKEALESIVHGAIVSSGGAAQDAIVIGTKGETIFAYGDRDLAGSDIATLANVALNTGQVEYTGDGFFVAVPAHFGKDNDIVGIVAISWTPEHALAALSEVQLRTNLIGGAVFLVSLIIVTFLLRNFLSKPLVRLREAMDEVSKAHYDTEVPNLNRKDEIGDIARTLDDFRTTLLQAEEVSRESAYKGAAFEASSASMLMVDQNLNVNYINTAFSEILIDNSDNLTGALKGLEPSQLIGKNISVFAEEGTSVHAETGVISETPHSVDIAIGEKRIEQSINNVLDKDGNSIGRVLEWNDVTEERLNHAILKSLDTNQARVEFKPDGSLDRANDNFCKSLGVSLNELVGQHCREIFLKNLSAAESVQDFWPSLSEGAPVFGQFSCSSSSHAALVFEGSFSPVIDRQGQVNRFVFIGADVTSVQLEIQQAEERRLKMAAEQEAVVEGLRVGLTGLSKGDLTSKINLTFAEHYEQLRLDFNAAVDSLRTAMGSVVDNSEMIRGETNEISKAADDLSRRTETQAATLEETAAALDEMTSSVGSAAEGAGIARKMVIEARDNAEASGEVVREAVDAMSEIASSSQQISKITSVIDEIAFQTNLLALNAGVEAANAGEAGRGFAVVATEVRDLALRSSQAASEINSLISASEGHVKRGVELVDQTGEALRGIFNRVSEISTHVGEIAVSADEQSRGLAEINIAVNQLDQVTQQNAAMFEETTAASHALTSEAENLATTMAQFVIAENGATNFTQLRPKHESQSPNISTKDTAPAKMVSNGGQLIEAPSENWEDF